MASFFNFARDARTFRPKKYAGPNSAQIKQRIDATLGNGDIYEAIVLPEGVEINEWLAVNTTDFYNSTMLLYSTLVEFCTPETCPVMSAGPKVGGERERERNEKGSSVKTTKLAVRS